MRHPSALTKFEHIMSASKGKQIVMFLDYDGTLSPIVDDPDSAFMSDAVRPSCARLLFFLHRDGNHSCSRGISDEGGSQGRREALPHRDR